VQGPPQLDAQALTEQCARQGVLIEPGDIFFNKAPTRPSPYFRLGYSAIAGGQIEPGIQALSLAWQRMGQVH
jgi:GntR family transcriptional regulator/MocR family aminotransferase